MWDQSVSVVVVEPKIFIFIHVNIIIGHSSISISTGSSVLVTSDKINCIVHHLATLYFCCIFCFFFLLLFFFYFLLLFFALFIGYK